MHHGLGQHRGRSRRASAQRSVAANPGAAPACALPERDFSSEQNSGRKHPMSFEGSVLKQRLRAHSWLIVLLAMLAMAPIGWSIFWFVKSRGAVTAVTAWMAEEARQGRVWSCPSQKIGGFPYTIAISCENMAFQGEVFGKTLS